VKGSSTRRILTDLVSLVRFAMHQENELVPTRARRRQLQGLAGANHPSFPRKRESRAFHPEQQHWLEMIRDHIAANLGIDLDDFEYAPFNKEGGLAACISFSREVAAVIEELNRELVA